MAPNATQVAAKTDLEYTYTSDKTYEEDTGSLKAQLAWRKKLKDAMAPEEYAFSARKRVWVHYWLGIRTFVWYFATAYLIWNYHDNPLIWIPAGRAFAPGCPRMPCGCHFGAKRQKIDLVKMRLPRFFVLGFLGVNLKNVFGPKYFLKVWNFVKIHSKIFYIRLIYSI